MNVLIYRFTPPATIEFQRDITRYVSGLKTTTQLHGGFGECRFTIASRWISAFDFYDKKLLWVIRVMGDNDSVAWEGRIEDIAVTRGGIEVTALGFYAHTRDKIYGIPWPSVVREALVVKEAGTDGSGRGYVEIDFDDSDTPFVADEYVTFPLEYYVVLESGGLTASIVGATWDADDPFTNANYYSLSFNGTSNRMEIAPDPRLNIPAAANFTLDLWVKLTSLPTQVGSLTTEGCLISNEAWPIAEPLSNARAFWRININTSGNVVCYISDGSPYSVEQNIYARTTRLTSSTTLSTGQWYLISLTVINDGGARAKLHINGVLRADVPHSLSGSAYSGYPVRVAFDNPANLAQNLYRYYTQGASHEIHATSLACKVHGVRISRASRHRNPFTPRTDDYPPDAWTVALFNLNENTGTELIDTSRPGQGQEGNTWVVDNTTTRLTVQGTWTSSLIPGDSVVLGHKATQGQVITDALSLCPLLSTDYSHVDAESELNLDVTPQEFNNGEKVQDVIEHITKYGTGDDDPRPVYFAIWEDRIPYLFPSGAETTKWRVSVKQIVGQDGLRLERSIKSLSNRTFAYYSDEEGEQQSTELYPDSLDAGSALKEDAEDSQAEYGVFDGALSLGNMDGTVAGLFAQQMLQDEMLPDHASEIALSGWIGGPAYARHALWEVRAGDVIEVVDLLDAELPINTKALRKLKKFLIKETDYEWESNTLRLTPEGEISTVDMLLSVADIGQGRT